MTSVAIRNDVVRLAFDLLIEGVDALPAQLI